MTLARATILKRVRRGARFLDRKVPKWHLDVVLPELKMEHGAHCILGQVGGDYYEYARDLGLIGKNLSEKRVVASGFSLDAKDYAKKNWSALAEAWAVEVGVRQVTR